MNTISIAIWSYFSLGKDFPFKKLLIYLMLPTQPQPHPAVFPDNSARSCLYLATFNLSNNRINIFTQLVDFADRGFQLSIQLSDIDNFASIFRFHIAAHRQVIVISNNGLKRDRFRQMSNIFLAGKYLHNLFDMGIGQILLLVSLNSSLASIN